MATGTDATKSLKWPDAVDVQNRKRGEVRLHEAAHGPCRLHMPAGLEQRLVHDGTHYPMQLWSTTYPLLCLTDMTVSLGVGFTPEKYAKLPNFYTPVERSIQHK